MQQILDNLKQALLNEHLPNEQIQNILNSVDLTKINLQDLPATMDYLGQFLLSIGLEENIISNINTSLMNSFQNLDISSLIPNQGSLLEDIKGIIGNMFGGD